MSTASVYYVPARHWLRSFLLGCTCYTLANGLFHKSDWCYLAASAAVAGAVFWGLQLVQGWLVARPPRWLQKLPLLWALSCMLTVFGLGVGLT